MPVMGRGVTIQRVLRIFPQNGDNGMARRCRYQSDDYDEDSLDHEDAYGDDSDYDGDSYYDNGEDSYYDDEDRDLYSDYDSDEDGLGSDICDKEVRRYLKKNRR